MPLYAGMTVNERLFIFGLIHDWDRAVARGDRTKMIEVLMATELTAEQAASTAAAVLVKRGEHGRALTAGVVKTNGRAQARPLTLPSRVWTQALSACSRSAIRSSLSSIPIDSRTTSGAAPDFTLAASSS
jgi:hypothetical protein